MFPFIKKTSDGMNSDVAFIMWKSVYGMHMYISTKAYMDTSESACHKMYVTEFQNCSNHTSQAMKSISSFVATSMAY